jgi:hypothetical protein
VEGIFMKKKIFAISLVTALSLSSVPVFAADSLAHLKTKEGIIDVVGYEVKDNENTLFVICEYQNTTDESCSPLFQFNITAYQDGIELDSSYSSYDPEGCKSSSTKIKPGATLKYAECYELSGSSDVEVEITPIFNFDNELAECTLDLSNEVPSEKSPDYKTMYEELKKQFDELQQKYDELVASQQ